MHMQTLRLRALAFVAGVAVLAFSGWASADPPSRVGRLGYMSGEVSFSPAGEIVCDPAEIVDARWFSRGDLPDIPPRISIARKLTTREA